MVRPISRGNSDEGADATATVAADGSLYVAFADDDVTFGPHAGLTQPYVAHVGRDGEILAYSAASNVGQFPYPWAIHPSVDRILVDWGTIDPLIAAYDADLTQLWQATLGRGFTALEAISSTGEVVAAAGMRDVSTATLALTYFDRDGHQRWSIPQPDTTVGALQFVDGGDVIAYISTMSGGISRRFAAADGSIVAEAMLPIDVPFIGLGFAATFPDGDCLVTSFAGAQPAMTRLSPTGEVRWTQRYEGVGAPVISPTGDVLLREGGSGAGFSVRVIDGATGVSRVKAPSCGYINVIGSDSERYFGLGLTGSSSVGLAGFAL